MELAQILAAYGDEALDRLASDKIDEVSGLRLPRPVLVREVEGALRSLSYVGRVLAPARPPTYAFLKLLMEAPDHRRPAAHFREAVLAATDELTAQAEEGRTLPGGKDYALYLRILRVAWENDGQIDRSEGFLLEALRKELKMWTREHLLLEHHPLVRPLWDGERAFDVARNHLLTTGVVLTIGDDYVVAEEVCRPVRAVWSIDLESADYRRLLDRLTVAQLRKALEAAALPLSGAKDERVDRVIAGLVPPEQVLDALHIDEVKDLCRECRLSVTAPKAELMASLVDCFERRLDLVPPTPPEAAPPPPPPEPRELDGAAVERLLGWLTLDQLQDILVGAGLRRSGTKPERVARLAGSPFGERTLLGHLPRAALAGVCRRLGLRLSGVKDDLVARLVERAQTDGLAAAPASPPQPAEADQPLAPEIADPASAPASDGASPPGLRGIQADFPDLERGEQVVLALLREARSLTEHDIQRAVRRHELGWFLTKAHMADLLARLARDGAPPVRIRSAGGVNIYEWVSTGCAVPDGLERDAARDVVDALRQGVVPERHLDLLAVGQDAARKHLVDLLGHVRTGRSEFKFVRGAYGAGKTLVLAWLRERAFDAGFAVATVRVGPDQPISDLPVFYAGLIQGLRTPEKRDSSALADVLESWLLTVHVRTARFEGLAPFDPTARGRLVGLVERRIEEDLARVAGIDASFAPALRQYYRAHVEDDAETAGIALAWLRGSRSLAADALRRIGVRGQLEGEAVFPRMRALLRVIAEGRLAGLLLLVDELELVRRFPHARQREQAYETLRLLVDEAGENGLPGCLMVCTGTDALFEDQRDGLASYEALANRICSPRAIEGRSSVRQPVIPLEPLDAERLRAVAQRVRAVHAVAYAWPAAERLPDPILDRLVEQSTSFAGGPVGRLPRAFLRELVHLLDVLEENPSIAAAECLRAPLSVADGLAAGLADVLGA